MRVMMIIKADPATEAETPPTPEALEAMGRYHEEMIQAGVLLDAAGLKPSSKGVRLLFKDGETRVVDGPFAETKELLAGYWLLQVQSLDEAIEWAKRCPYEYIPRPGGVPQIEVRALFEEEDFDTADAEAQDGR